MIFNTTSNIIFIYVCIYSKMCKYKLFDKLTIQKLFDFIAYIKIRILYQALLKELNDKLFIFIF